MLRTRIIGAAPRRGPLETWEIISSLVADTLDQSDAIDGPSVLAVLSAADKAGLPLVAGGHLEKHPIVLVAPPVHLSIFTLSGDEALSFDENLSPVPGGASSKTWKVHLPSVDPLVSVVSDAVKESEFLTDSPLPDSVDERSAMTASRSVIDRDALAKRNP